jgi:hypothetical protein
MSYITVEVDIDQGRIVPRDPQKLPEKGKGLLTILPSALDNSETRPFALAKGQFAVPADFNSPLPEELMRSFEGA